MGMFDTVHFNCPSCGQKLSEQSKAGGCDLRDYTMDSVPVSIAESLNGHVEICSGCGAMIRLRTPCESYFTTMYVEPVQPD